MLFKRLQWFKIPAIKRGTKILGGGYTVTYKLVTELEMKALKRLKISESGLNKGEREGRYIVSLTTYGDRINTVHYTIRTLLNQTYKPDKIILWLAEEFKDVTLPKDLINLEKYGLEIRYCEELRSHKKYYFAMQEFPDDIIITFDDDIIYPEDQIEKLVKTSKKFPGSVVANIVSKLEFDENFELLYHQDEREVSFGMEPEILLLPIGCGGVLYPPHCLDKEVFNKENIIKYAYTVDDLWLKVMALKNGVKAVKTQKWIRPLSCVKGSQKTMLAQVNCIEAGNEKSMRKILGAYPEIKEIIKGDC